MTAEATTEVAVVDRLTPITEIQPAPLRTISSTALVLDHSAMESVMRIADTMAMGKTTIPKHLQQNPGDCFAVCMQAMQWGMNPFSVAQKTHLVNGTLGYEAQLVIAVLNASPALATRLDWRWSDNWAGVNGKADKSDQHWVEVWAVLKGETTPRLLRVSMAQVGDVRNSPNWASDPRQQIAYLAAKRWGRLHAPDVILGVYTPDELAEGAMNSDVASLPRNATPIQIASAAAPKAERTDRHASMIADLEIVAAEQGTKAFKKAWNALDEADRVAIGIPERDRLLAMGGRTDEQAAKSAAAVGHQQAEATNG